MWNHITPTFNCKNYIKICITGVVKQIPTIRMIPLCSWRYTYKQNTTTANATTKVVRQMTAF